MPKQLMRLAPRHMVELCDWVEETDPTLMVEALPEAMRDQANDAIRLMPHLASGSDGRQTILLEATIDGHEDHIMYALMRWPQIRKHDAALDAKETVFKTDNGQYMMARPLR